MHSVNEEWLSTHGTVVVQKRHRAEPGELSDWETLLFSVWCVDFMLRQRGKLDRAPVTTPGFLKKAWNNAIKLGLPITVNTFQLSHRVLESEFPSRFDAICDELRNAR